MDRYFDKIQDIVKTLRAHARLSRRTPITTTQTRATSCRWRSLRPDVWRTFIRVMTRPGARSVHDRAGGPRPRRCRSARQDINGRDQQPEGRLHDPRSARVTVATSTTTTTTPRVTGGATTRRRRVRWYEKRYARLLPHRGVQLLHLQLERGLHRRSLQEPQLRQRVSAPGAPSLLGHHGGRPDDPRSVRHGVQRAASASDGSARFSYLPWEKDGDRYTYYPKGATRPRPARRLGEAVPGSVHRRLVRLQRTSYQRRTSTRCASGRRAPWAGQHCPSPSRSASVTRCRASSTPRATTARRPVNAPRHRSRRRSARA